MTRSLTRSPLTRLWLLFIAATTLSAFYSYRRPHALHYARQGMTVEVAGREGRLWFGHMTRASGDWVPAFYLSGSEPWDYLFRVGGSTHAERLGFGYAYAAGKWHILVVPYWAILLVSLLTPLAARPFRGRRARRRVAAGLCVKCGYDLRASPRVCPECGTPVEDAARRPLRAVWSDRWRRRVAEWGLICGGLATLVSLSDAYLRERRAGFPTAAESLRLFLALLAITAAVSAFKVRERDEEPGHSAGGWPNLVPLLALTLGLFNTGYGCGFCFPRLNY